MFCVAFYERWCVENGVDLWQASDQDVARFIKWYSDRAGRYSVIRRLSSLKFLYRYAVSLGLRHDNPAAPIHLKPPRLPPAEPFSEPALRRLYAACRTLREQAMLAVFMDSGCRLGELAGMHGKDIDWARGRILVRGKGQRLRLVTVSQPTLELLRRYTLERSGPVWLTEGFGNTGNQLSVHSCYRIVRDVGRRAGVQKTHPHRFRTTFANIFHQATSGDIQSLQLLMGHSKVSTTLRYSGWSAGEYALMQHRRVAIAERILPPDPKRPWGPTADQVRILREQSSNIRRALGERNGPTRRGGAAARSSHRGDVREPTLVEEDGSRSA